MIILTGLLAASMCTEAARIEDSYPNISIFRRGSIIAGTVDDVAFRSTACHVKGLVICFTVPFPFFLSEHYDSMDFTVNNLDYNLRVQEIDEESGLKEITVRHSNDMWIYTYSESAGLINFKFVELNDNNTIIYEDEYSFSTGSLFACH
ncbi:hypothetical protein [Woodsholea maritima]|uniref:hypothetical protein n=1 Tax=Woodsholea maritima TaxID=240237 RepID=UPI000592BA3F|nr:hypothetical protein [Woodsholea maritima]